MVNNVGIMWGYMGVYKMQNSFTSGESNQLEPITKSVK